MLEEISPGAYSKGITLANSLGNGDEVGTMRRVHQPVIKVLVGNKGGIELAVVDPDVGAFLTQSQH